MESFRNALDQERFSVVKQKIAFSGRMIVPCARLPGDTDYRKIIVCCRTCRLLSGNGKLSCVYGRIFALRIIFTLRVKIFQHRIRRISCIFQALQKADGIQRVYAVTCSADSGINLCVSENRCLFSRSGKRAVIVLQENHSL